MDFVKKENSLKEKIDLHEKQIKGSKTDMNAGLLFFLLFFLGICYCFIFIDLQTLCLLLLLFQFDIGCLLYPVIQKAYVYVAIYWVIHLEDFYLKV